MWIALGSALLLIPCFWQSRLQMGDLGSHIYNAWLAQLIESGRAAGLAIVPQKTNVLFDWVLTGLFRVFGAGPAQRVSVAASVLLFAWGAFAFAAAVSGRRPWELLPLIAVLAHGWTLHMGFMNFYLSLGLCLWAMTLAWSLTLRGLLLAAPLLGIAFLAHAVPVAWAAGVLAYAWIWRLTAVAHRRALLVGALLCMGLGVAALRDTLLTARSNWQGVNSIGLDQSIVFGSWYTYIAVGLTVCCALLFFELVRRLGFRETLQSVAFQIWILTVGIVVMVPNRVMLPSYKNSFVFIADRMSLAVGVCLCAALASAPASPARRVAVWGIGVASLVFFGFLYADERVLNQMEDQMEALVRQLPPYQRVIGGLADPSVRVEPLIHMIDRICVGHCYSYGNYEPSTDQFRIRVTAPNRIVAATYEDSMAIQTGGYVVKQQDLPLYQVALDETGGLTVRVLTAGAVVQVVFSEVL